MLYPDQINDSNRNKVIGYLLDSSGIYSGKNIIMAINSSSSLVAWSSSSGPGHTDIPGLTNYLTENDSIKDKNGKSNTKIIVDYINSKSGNLETDVPATYYCTSYNPGFHDGEWYLPSIGELMLLGGLNIEKFRSDCDTAGISTDIGTSFVIWSSTEKSGSAAYFFNSSGIINAVRKNIKIYIIPFLSID